MINYAKHDEEFYGIFKLVSGEEVLGKAVITDDENETLVFIQDPVAVQVITKEIDEQKVARGMGFAPWMQMSDEDFFIIREKDIIAVASMKKEMIILYEAYLLGEGGMDKKKKETHLELDPSMGYLGSIDNARSLFEKIYRS